MDHTVSIKLKPSYEKHEELHFKYNQFTLSGT